MISLTENPLLGMSWYDSAWVPLLNPTNVLDYFCERSNPFYDHMCNNQIIKSQRLSQEQLNNMVGIEYILLHVQEPILYVIRKQHRFSPTQVTPLADYYIVNGVVHLAPDLYSVINARLLNTVSSLQSAFDEAMSYSRYHPSKGYSWEFSEKEEPEKKESSDKKKKEEPSSFFQRQRVDNLLGELAKKFPPKVVQPIHTEVKEEPVKQEAVVKQEIKQEKPDDKANSIKPPPEKRAKLTR
ncbi:mediator of RNA polymerase II transcription subunit 6-like isoform X1 [Crassostrea angulata]|uniref:mediator of RNA polymerase II transcription subunit 6-like isoform X1 n=1 Tax=Magallana angulata TaxID=2784310 RepID=UPI0022B19508|nr:mediator of RNA polymerase II transcription subunit 6-like isoform X1 [Crassostrea angulata]